MTAKQGKQTRYLARKGGASGVIGRPDAITGNRPEALNLLLAVVSQVAPERANAARATTRPLEAGEAPEEILVRRARLSDLRSRHQGQTGEREPLDTFMIVCGGEPTMLCTFAEARDTLSRMPLLSDARWTLVDLDKAPQVYDGR